MFYQRRMAVFSALLLACSLLLSSCSTPLLTVSYYARAFEKLWMPAHSGNPRAQYALGYLYYYGLGTVRDEDFARLWFKRAADCHYPPAVEAYRRMTDVQFEQYVPMQSKTGKKTYSYKRFYGDNEKTRKSK
jgi:hypothetical protein